MMKPREIWVLPELNNTDGISKLSLGLLSEAKFIADKVSGTVKALVLSDRNQDYSEIFSHYGVSSAYLFEDPLLKYYSAEPYFDILAEKIQNELPWLFLMGNTIIGKEVAPRLSVFLETGLITNCVKIDFTDPNRPKFLRPVYAGQLYQEVIFQTDRTMLVTMDPDVLNIDMNPHNVEVNTSVFKPNLSTNNIRIRHEEFLHGDFRTIDITDADVILSVGMGIVTSDMLPLAEELATLIGGAIGTTRPVVDEGVLPKKRMIGQTGKVVNPKFYLAMGISGASHHLGGIQDSGTIVSINCDPNAPIFQNSDIGIIGDVREILPKLVEKIKHEKGNGSIL